MATGLIHHEESVFFRQLGFHLAKRFIVTFDLGLSNVDISGYDVHLDGYWAYAAVASCRWYKMRNISVDVYDLWRIRITATNDSPYSGHNNYFEVIVFYEKAR